MKVLIVAKTRRGPGACVGGIAEDGRSVRLIAFDAATNERAGVEYEVGEVWEIESAPDADIVPPHVENIIVLRARRLRRSGQLEHAIHRFMPPVAGGPEKLFDGLPEATAAGALYVSERTGFPPRSTMFWVPDQPLELDVEGKRIRYRYEARSITYVGFQEPLPRIPAGTLLRVSLAHRWRPPDRPHEELRCFVQLSGWFLDGGERSSVSPKAVPQQTHAIAASSLDLVSRASAVLKETFGFSKFLPVQGDVINRVLQRKDTLVVMPTGGGKSLCYQLPALLFEGVTVVVSPLVALMQDQVRQLRALDVPAACLNHMVPLTEWTTITGKIRSGAIKLLFVAPETLLRPEILLLLEQSRLACIAIDEAHCISEWGHDFRPEYRQLRDVRRRFPAAACLLLTATATARVREDIRRLLNIAAEGEFIASFNRANLFLQVERRRDELAQVVAFLEKRRGESGIIYCGKRKQVDELCAQLNANGWTSLPYHAGLPDQDRRRNQERFIGDDVPLMVATVAFGMGINKSNVRFVIHAHLPKDIEGYYQEVGRAGRDGLPADCLLLYSRADAMLHRRFIDEGAASERAGRNDRLNALMNFAEIRECRRVPLLAYFGETLAAPCGHCDNCTAKPAPENTVDASPAARLFLECVRATGQFFGPTHIIAVLRGSKAERVLDRGHDQLPVYGAGREHSSEQWRELARQFLQLGIAEQDLQFGGVRITYKGRQVLEGKETVMVVAEPAAARAAAPTEAEPFGGHYESELFERLRRLRREVADEIRLPAYMVFSDRALVEMATLLPQTPAQLLVVNGVGQVKLAKHGEAFLSVIRDFCAERGLAAAAPVKPAAADSLLRPVTRARRSTEAGELFGLGQTIEEIANHYQVTHQTIVQYLGRFIQEGGRVDPDRLRACSRLSEADRARVVAAFERLGIARLAPVYEALGGSVSYEELQLLRVYLLSLNPSG